MKLLRHSAARSWPRSGRKVSTLLAPNLKILIPSIHNSCHCTQCRWMVWFSISTGQWSATPSKIAKENFFADCGSPWPRPLRLQRCRSW